MFKGKWFRVWEMLKANGLSKEGAKKLNSELDWARAYKYEHIAVASTNALEEVYI